MFSAGCQGWNYEDWITPAGGEHVFYPPGTKSPEMLELYSRVFDTVEVDSTFYASPSAKTFESWRERSSDGFRFSLKMPREITHELRLRPASFPATENFLARASLLGKKLGAVLIQLPPSFSADRENARSLRAFLDFIPRHLDFAVEFRDPGWLVDWTLGELEKRGVWLCVVEGEWIDREKFFGAMARPSDLPLYVRFMGARDLERFDRVCRPQDDLFSLWHKKLTERPDRSAYVYISNLTEGFAPASVNKFRRLSGLEPSDPGKLEIQNRLFG